MVAAPIALAGRGLRSLACGLVALGCAVASAASAAPVVRFDATPIQGDVCVAPCAVHFDAIGDGLASHTYDPDYTRPFHALHFAWGFSDALPGTWRVSGRSKQSATGAIAGHLYETPGSYDVALRVTNPAGVSRGIVMSKRVTVADPDVVFANTTWCFANTGTPGGAGFEQCPVRARSRHVVIGWQASGGFDQALAACGALRGKSRCLFRAGDYFAGRETFRLSDAPGPGLVSRFGSGPNPVVYGGDGFLILRNGWTVAHFDVYLKSGSLGPLLLVSGYSSRVTAFDVRAPIVHNTCFESSVSSTPSHTDLVAVVEVECHLQNSSTGATPAYLRAERVLFLGNWIDNHYEGQFNLRTVHLPRSVIQHSRFERPGAGGNNRRNVMQLRAWSGSNSGGAPIGPAPSPTEFVIVSDNVLSQDDSDVGIRTCQSNDCVDTTRATEMRDLIFERNFFHFSTGSGQPPGQMMRGFWLQGGDITVRNNVFDLQGISTLATPARNRLVWHDPNLASAPQLDDDRVHVLNNTVYYDDPSPNGFQICGGGSFGAGHLCRNNLVYAPGETGIREVSDSAAWSPAANLFVSASPFAAPVPGQASTDILDFLLAPTAVARDTGWDPRSSSVSVWGDLQSRCRPETSASPTIGGDWDVGAAEFESGVHCMVTPEPGTALLLGGGLALLARRGRSVRRIT